MVVRSAARDIKSKFSMCTPLLYVAEMSPATALRRLAVLCRRLRFELVEPFPHKRQILHVKECDVEHVTYDHYRAAGLHYFQYAHVHRFAPHGFDERQHDVPAIEYRNRQHI